MTTLLRTQALAIAAMLLGIGFAFAQTRPLNDTGITFCGAATGGNTPAPCASNPAGQDKDYGRDAAALAGTLVKVGGSGGVNGFDFTKIANNGTVLPASALLGSGPTEWACTRDNVTALIWEVKTTSGLRGGQPDGRQAHGTQHLALAIAPAHRAALLPGCTPTAGRARAPCAQTGRLMPTPHPRHPPASA